MDRIAHDNQALNFLELFEARSVTPEVLWGAETAACDEKTIVAAAAGEAELIKIAEGPGSVLAFLSVCSDETDSNESDVRLKTDITQVGTTAFGLPLYQFRYRNGGEACFEGVMAQDVLEVMPDAVTTGEDGFYRVRYSDLGIKMKRI